MSAEQSKERERESAAPKLSLWMVNYNSASLIEKSLESLRSEPIDDIFIWDNGSGPADVAALVQIAAADTRVELFVSAENLGFGAAVNAIADRSAGSANDVIWILNPDTEFLTGSVRLLKNEVIRGSVDIVSPLIVCGLLEDPVVWFYGGKINMQTGLCVHDDYGLKNWTDHSELRLTSFMTGAAPMMTREVWDRIGGFHEELFLYWEDVELSLRATDLNLSMGVHPGCTVWHLEGGSGSSSSGHSTAYYFYNARNRIRVCADRVGLWNVAVGPGFKETVLTILRPLLREKTCPVRKSLAALHGTFSGIFARGGLGSRRLTGIATSRLAKADNSDEIGKAQGRRTSS